MDQKKIVSALSKAYIELVAFGWSQRETVDGQALLADLRDSIASLTGETSQAVQERAEQAAYHRRNMV